MIVGIPLETNPGERRVALAPVQVPALLKAGLEVLVQTGAGAGSGFPDDEYREKGARLAGSREELFAAADILFVVRGPGANPETGAADLALLRPGQIVIGHHEPLGEPERVRELAGRGVVAFAMELMPRITRAQAMDTLSSMATIAGYRAVILAAMELPRLFPLLMTAAGTLSPAKVFIVGVGVAGLQAIATARRLGAVVEAYDVRPAVAEQVRSLGARFVELELQTSGAEAAGGYAREQSPEFLRRQRELMQAVVSASDVVITTAAVPGRRAPVLVTAEMVRAMRPGSVVVDVAAERGGNCELTVPGETVREGGVAIMGPLNLPSGAPAHASQMYGKNLSNFLLPLVKEGQWRPDDADEIVAGTLLCRDGEVVHPAVRERLQAQG